jgi:phosphatidylserine/phosphatidylglycerophosphate/cardiolipin synthase-like enzyme
MATVPNLNELGVPVEHEMQPQRDNGLSTTAPIQIIFKNHQARLLEEIRRWPIVLGCVAWLTDRQILRALAACEHVNIIVQKEDFLRPDIGGRRAASLRPFYDSLPSPLSRYELPAGISGFSYCSDPSIEAVRCVGNHNRQRLPAWPRMHNKFLVFCDRHVEPDQWEGNRTVVLPRRVWTGSYNLSATACRSWENAILIDSPEVAEAYTREFAQILTFSERLDWESDWVEPEYRIGS